MHFISIIMIHFICLAISNLLQDVNSYGFDYYNANNPHDCGDGEYFNVISLNCSICDQSKHLKPSPDRMTCTCDDRSIITGWKNGFPLCKRCRDTEIPSSDFRSCLKCNGNVKFASKEQCFRCDADSIFVEQYQNETDGVASCFTCSTGSLPSLDRRSCHWCDPYVPLCACSSTISKCSYEFGLNPSSQDYRLDYGDFTLDSLYLRTFLNKYTLGCQSNNTATCHALANMCVISLYSDNGYGPCKILKELKRQAKPWLYYSESEAPSIVSKIAYPKYSMEPNSEFSHLKIVAHKWMLNGSWLSPVMGLSQFELCPGFDKIKPGRFSVDYSNSCTIKSSDLLNRPTVFYDLYLEYKHNNKSILHPIPILFLDYKKNNKFINKINGMQQWQLTRRIFIVDNVGGYKYSEPTTLSFIRYLKSLTFRVNVRSTPNEGMIYIPFMIVSYGVLRNEDIESLKEVKVKFKIEFQMTDNVKRNSDIALSVLCTISVIWSCVRAWSEIRRSGQRPLDLLALARLAIISSGHLANSFFFVSIGLALHSWSYYKCQAVVHVILPSSRLVYLVTVYIIVAFPLKLLDVLVMIWRQATVDIFLIDWEHPRVHKSCSPFVSAWRTYFVANKWHDLQTIRKTNTILQLTATVTILKIFGFEFWALKEPELNTWVDDRIKFIDYSVVFRISVACLVYSAVYVTQWTFINFLYDRYIRNSIQEFVDICSLTNISVFILSYENYGFYIHGRSAHGFSDTDMATLRKQLRQEEEDLVGHRGLVPASDNQTFTIVIPPKLRLVYKSLINNIFTENSHFPFPMLRKQGVRSNSGDIIMQSYININRFLAAFIEHALKDLDYEVRDRQFVEALFDIDIYNVNGKGIFFNDNGHSFDNVLFYGNEFSLFTFNLMFFCFIEIFCQNYLLSAILTGLLDQAIAAFKRFGSRKNFSKKTLVDKHFLP